jgi:hypothetical protein
MLLGSIDFVRRTRQVLVPTDVCAWADIRETTKGS